MKLKVKKLVENAKLPARAHMDDAGYDCFSCERAIILRGETARVDTGISLQLVPDNDNCLYGIFIHERSSLGSKGIARRAGLIDQSYRGSIIICLTNHTNETVYINEGDKIAQFVIQKVETPLIEEVEELDDTERGSSGFGSTNKK